MQQGHGLKSVSSRQRLGLRRLQPPASICQHSHLLLFTDHLPVNNYCRRPLPAGKR